MSRSYKDKLMGISYSIIFAFVNEDERCFCDVQHACAYSPLPGRFLALSTVSESTHLRTTATDIIARMPNVNAKIL